MKRAKSYLSCLSLFCTAIVLSACQLDSKKEKVAAPEITAKIHPALVKPIGPLPFRTFPFSPKWEGLTEDSLKDLSPPKGLDDLKMKFIDSSKSFSPTSISGKNLGGHVLVTDISKDQQQLLMVSMHRREHRSSEIYIYDLRQNRALRSTYQSGNIFWAKFHPKNNRLFFQANSEEKRENTDALVQELINKYDKKAESIPSYSAIPPENKKVYDEFLSKFHGSKEFPYNGIDLSGEIYTAYYSTGTGTLSKKNRLTTSRGFDGDFALSSSNDLLFYSSHASSKWQLQSISPQPANPRRNKPRGTGVISKRGRIGHLAINKEGNELVWIHENNSLEKVSSKPSSSVQPSSIISLGKVEKRKVTQIESIKIPDGQHWYPRWTPDGAWLVFSSNLALKNIFSLFAFSKSMNCLVRLTSGSTYDVSPVISPDGKTLYFSRLDLGQLKVFFQPLKLPTSCQ